VVSLINYRHSPAWDEIWRTVVEAGSGRIYTDDQQRQQLMQEYQLRSFEQRLSRVLPEHETEQFIDILRQFSKLGSNSVVIAPQRSKSGAPLIANDPHLGLSLPNLWLLAGLHSPSYKLVGMMPATLPVFGVGRNERIAWGGTNLHAANSDLYDISDLPAASLQTHEETLHTRYWFDRTIRYQTSPYGPVISDAPLIPEANGRRIALKWIGHGVSDEITAMLRVNRAGDWRSFQAALRSFATPSQNMVYADVEGHIGRLTATHVPYRTQKTPRDIYSDRREYAEQWGRIVDVSELPSTFIPRGGIYCFCQ
jgi:Protein related to penicillin acylase